MERQTEEALARHFPLVWSLVHRLGPVGVEKEDLFQAGCLGLVKAWQRYDPGLGTAFSTYAVPVILGEMRRYLREGRAVKVPRPAQELVGKARQLRARLAASRGEEPPLREVAEVLGVPAADLLAAEEACSPPRSLEEGVGEGAASLLLRLSGAEERYEEAVDLREALALLEPRERAIIVGRYFSGFTQGELAEKMGISQPQVSRLEQRALRRLREALSPHTLSEGRLN